MKRNCAIIGMGLLGVQHADRLHKHSTTQVVAVCDILLDKAKTWAEANSTNYYNDCEDMLKKEKIDILVIATQDPYHKEPLIAACAHNVPFVICEKPLTTTLEDAMEVLKAAENSDTLIKILYPNRFYPIDQTIRYLLEKDLIGDIEYGEFRIDDSIDVPLILWGKDSKHYASISSPVHFLFSHAIDLLGFMLQRKITKVYAIAKQSIIGSEVDYMDCFLTYEGGIVIRLKTEWTKRIPRLVENYMQMTGKKGGFVFNKTGGFQCQQGLFFALDEGEDKAKDVQTMISEHGYSSSIEKYGDTGGYAVVMREEDKGNAFDWNEGICFYADSFYDAEPKLSPLTSLEDGIEQVKIVEALHKSAKEGREIVL